MASLNGLHKLSVVIFNLLKHLFQLKHQNCTGDGSLKKTSDHIWQPEKRQVNSSNSCP